MNIGIRADRPGDIAVHRDLNGESPAEISRIDCISGKPPLSYL